MFNRERYVRDVKVHLRGLGESESLDSSDWLWVDAQSDDNAFTAQEMAGRIAEMRAIDRERLKAFLFAGGRRD